MTESADPFDRDSGPRLATPTWTMVLLVALIIAAMLIDVARSAGSSLWRSMRGAAPLREAYQ